MDHANVLKDSSSLGVSFYNCNTRTVKPGCSNDRDCVAILPFDWVPRHSGPILANYLKEREIDHNNIYDDIVKCAAVANDGVNAKLLTLAKQFLARIDQKQIEMDCVVNDYSKTCEGVLSAEDLKNAFKTIHKIKLERYEEKSFFMHEATTLEKERAEKLKRILREKFQLLVKVGHVTPKDLVHDFDQRIYEINHQLLSNTRAFKEFEACLRVQLDQTVLYVKNALNQLSLGIVVEYRGRHSHSALRRPMEDTILERLENSARRTDANLKESMLLQALDLEECVGRIVEAYRHAAHSIFTGIFNKMAKLERNLVDQCFCYTCDWSNDFNDIRNLIDRSMNQLSTISSDKASNQNVIGMEVIMMQKSLCSLGERLRDTYFLLIDAARLWENHILRFALAQKLTITAVEDLLTQNDTIQLETEVPISIALEQLRCAPDEEKLNQQYRMTLAMLNQSASMYLRHSEAELWRLQEFMNLPPVMTNLLLAEFNLFLEKYSEEMPSQELAVPLTISHTPNYYRIQVPPAIRQTELYEQSLRNWRNGFLETFKNNIVVIPGELKNQAQVWVENRGTTLHMRYSLKMISHNIRVERIQTAHKVRLAELQQHENRLQSHLMAINALIEKLPLEASLFASGQEPFLYPIVDWVNRIKTGVDEIQAQDPPNPEVKKLKMASYALRLPRYRNFYEESLQKAVDEYQLTLENRLHEARISNTRFLSHIKLFSEGGNYASQEAGRTCYALTKASDMLENCFKNISVQLKFRQTQLLEYVNYTYIQPLLQVIERDTEKPEKVKSKSTKH